MKALRRLLGRPIDLGKRFVVLGLDGLDPELVRTGIESGDLPNFKRLANRGGFTPLETTWMPLSPVAWSSFISGSNPGVHGIFDFLHRDPETLEPHLSIARQHDAPRRIDVGPYSLPLSSGHTEQGRRGPAFWTEASRQGVRTHVIRCPVSFPPEPVRGKMLSGLGVPDLKGTQGSFVFLTTDASVDTASRAGTVEVIEHPAGGSVDVVLEGPPNPFLCDRPPTTLDLTIEVDANAARIRTPGDTVTLQENEWSGWTPVTFSFLGPVDAEGQVRFYLKSLRPEFELYCSPVNVSPKNPAFPISYPEGYASRLAEEIGRFHTLGLTADTGMLKEGRVEEVAFLEQAGTVLEERVRMLKRELTRCRDGLFTFVFDIPDRIQHMMWRHRDPRHALHTAEGDKRYGDVIDRHYERLDGILGWVLDELGPDDDLVICSDHGFNSFRREVDLNTWLFEQGYLVLQDGASPDDAGLMFGGVDWDRTRAYAFGLAGIYLNRRGREQHGILDDEDARSLGRKICDELTDLTDDAGEGPVVSRARMAEDVYAGEAVPVGPDVLVGYHRGYRVSWDSVLGGVTGRTLSMNENPWSGDHCVDPSLISGSFLSSFPVGEGTIGLSDVMPGVFDRLGLDAGNMEGNGGWIKT